MDKEMTEIYCGDGRGKTAMALGQSIRAATQGKSVIVIQFLKGKEPRALDFLENIEGLDIKIFRFDKHEQCYDDLNEEERAEENLNILNGIHFARKVVVTDECDFLILDEILGLFEYGIIPLEKVTDILKVKRDSMHIILTGRYLPDGLREYADRITTVTDEIIAKKIITREEE